MSPKSRIQALKELLTWPMPVRLNPLLDPFTRPLQFLAGCAPHDPRHSLAVFFPEELKAKESEHSFHARMKTAEP